MKEEFEAKLKDEVRLVVFTKENECPHCEEMKTLAQEIAQISSKIKVEIHDFAKDNQKARDYSIDKVPAIAVIGRKDFGIRYYGVPLGYEFTSLVNSMINVSKGTTNLAEETKGKLKSISKPVRIQVFVTLTCPYCSTAAGLAYKFALENDLLQADVVDVDEFPHLGQKYGIMGVPKTVINEKIEIVGAVPEAQLLAHVLKA